MENVISEYKGQHIPDRISCYPKVAEQLDKLWHDIDAGLFGEDAKTGQFFLAIQKVKNEHPKG
jgi:hypothetical protein